MTSELTDEAGQQRWADLVASHQGDSLPKDPARWIRILEAEGILSPLQVTSLEANPPRSLRFGNYVLSSAEPVPPSQWMMPARRIADDQVGWLARVDSVDESIRRHLAVSHEHLQSFESKVVGNQTAIFSAIPRGYALDRLAQSVDRSKVLKWLLQVSSALAAMHRAGLVHGQVDSDRIWLTKGGDALLLRDPAGWLQPPSDPSRNAAPERFDEGSLVDRSAADRKEKKAIDTDSLVPSTHAHQDVYALGCWATQLLLEQHPFESDDFASTERRHREHTPAEIQEAIQQGAAGDPLYRVIGYAIAKDATARLTDGEALHRALQACQPTSSSPASTEPDVSKPEKENDLSRRGSGATPRVTREGTLEPEEVPPRPVPRPTLPLRGRVTPKEELRGPSLSSPGENIEPKEDFTTPRVPNPAPPPTEESVHRKAQHAGERSVETEAPLPATSQDPSPASQSEQEPTHTDPPLRLPTATRRKRRSLVPFVFAGMVAIIAFQIAYLAIVDPEPRVVKRPSRPPIPAVVPSVLSSKRALEMEALAKAAASSTIETPGVSQVRFSVVDHPELLYVPPSDYENKPPPLTLLPPGPSGILVIGGAAGSGIQIDGRIANMIQTIAPEVSDQFNLTLSTIGVEASDVARITFGLYPFQGGKPKASMVVDLVQPRSRDQWREDLNVVEAQTASGATLWIRDDDVANAFFLDPHGRSGDEESISRFAFGPIKKIEEVAANEGDPVRLVPRLQELWDQMPGYPELGLLVQPMYLFGEGRSLLGRSVPQLSDPLREILIPDTGGLSLWMGATSSDDLGGEVDAIYLEGRVSSSGQTKILALRDDLRKQLASIPERTEATVANWKLDQPWSQLADRLPMMVSYVVDQVRMDVADRLVTFNVYLPDSAATTFAAGMMLAGNAVTIEETVEQVAKASSLKELLPMPVDLVFERNDLIDAVAALRDSASTRFDGDQMPAFDILGSDLQKLGITQNQPIAGFDRRQVPLIDVLTDLMIAANPDQSERKPSDENQTIVWAVDIASRPTRIVITTREAAMANENYRLGPAFSAQ
ncbi:MAG: hypothetical protein AAF664_19590 [Planctomycetota bacterium]